MIPHTMQDTAEEMIDAAAEAIANVREDRRGRPHVGNIDWLPFDYRRQLQDEARAAVLAAFDKIPRAFGDREDASQMRKALSR